jgi:hypothetical protein
LARSISITLSTSTISKVLNQPTSMMSSGRSFMLKNLRRYQQALIGMKLQ